MTGVGRPPLRAPVQIAYAVTDVEAAAAVFAETTGAGPFFVIPHIALASARVRGADGAFDHSSAYGQWGPVMVELVEEHTPPLVRPGDVHHLAFMVDSLARAALWCERQGWSEVLHAETTGGQVFAFHDARAERGHLVELYEPSDRLVAFYAMVAAAATDWDGHDPVRRLT
jgi:catechol 2,3-dioxygenase-like lactoylglutathione lyase family enzyme